MHHYQRTNASCDVRCISSAFAENPIGVNFDPDYLLERLHSGADPAELLQQGAGTRPGTKTPRALTWKTL